MRAAPHRERSTVARMATWQWSLLGIALTVAIYVAF
jgi:hypothetical protein